LTKINAVSHLNYLELIVSGIQTLYMAKSLGMNDAMATTAMIAQQHRERDAREQASKDRENRARAFAQQEKSNAALAESNRAAESAADTASAEAYAAKKAAENAASESRKLRTQIEKQEEAEEDRRQARNLLVDVSLLLDELKAKYP
jgi:hypothetical protein